jgi:hypothetical protein
VPTFSKKTALAVLITASATLAAAATAQAPPRSSATFEGPAGRTPLQNWTLRRDPANRGIALGWRTGRFAGDAVSVPNVLSPRAFSGPAGTRNYEGSVVWYRTSFQAARPGVYALSFQSANFQASVWIDGHPLGSHRGPYLPFEVRTNLLEGTHTVAVRIDWRDPSRQSQEGYHRTWFNWGGLNGKVDVRAIGPSELSDPIVQTTLQGGGADAKAVTVKVSATVRNNGPRRTILPEGTLVHGAQTVPVGFVGVTLAHGQATTVSKSVTVSEPALWSPRDPNLYTLTLTVANESGYSARIGLRQLTWHAGRLYLNGERLRLHGATIQEDALGHGDALTPADEGAIVAELKAIGANAARAQHALTPGLLERLDAAGILVWQGIGPVEGAGNWFSTTPGLLGQAEQQARTAVLQTEIHPSVIAWNLVDEVAGNGRNSAEVQYVRTLSRWLHARDPTRLVAVDVWGDHPPQHPGPLYSEADAVAETDYSGWYHSHHETQSQLRTEMRQRLATMRRTFPGKVLVISEFGAESNGLNPSGSPGSYSYQSRLLALHIAVYRAEEQLSGMFVWVLRDYPLTPTFEGGSIHTVLPNVHLIEGLNQKGLFDYGGRPKPAAGVVGRMFRALATG